MTTGAGVVVSIHSGIPEALTIFMSHDCNCCIDPPELGKTSKNHHIIEVLVQTILHGTGSKMTIS
jgi:hypothetical protein